MAFAEQLGDDSSLVVWVVGVIWPWCLPLCIYLFIVFKFFLCISVFVCFLFVILFFQLVSIK